MKFIKQVAKALGLKTAYIILRHLVLKLRGFDLLNFTRTVSFMEPYQIRQIPSNRTSLPSIINCADNEAVISPQKESITDQLYVWDYRDSTRTARLSKYGSVILKQKVLCTDWSHNSFLKGVQETDERDVKTVPLLIAPFSHFQDGIMYGGYYDFVFLVAAKLCRIKDTLSDEDFSNAVISYPLFNASYEKEYFQFLGINTANVIDSSTCKVVAPRVITANSGHWHPNVADVLSLKKHIESKFKPVKTAPNRIYISRTGRRCITNEDELITLLKRFNFLIIEDKPRTVTGQISIYYNASFIMGPHGASFSNIIWCQPGTHLFELFSPNYAPDFFLYLSTLMEMKYSAFYNGFTDSKVDYLDGLTEDIYVPIPKLEACLNSIFENEFSVS